MVEAARRGGANAFDINEHLSRRLYTRHGLHMRYAGKRCVAAALAGCIKSRSSQPEPPPPATITVEEDIVNLLDTSDISLDDSDMIFLGKIMSTPIASKQRETGECARASGSPGLVERETPLAVP